MRRLTTVALVLIVLAVLGYFSWLNRQTVSVSVYGTFTIQLQLWMVMAVFFVAGFLLAESRNLSKYPTRFLQMLQQGWQGWRLHRRLNALEAFEEACLRCAGSLPGRSSDTGTVTNQGEIGETLQNHQIWALSSFICVCWRK